MPADCLLNTSGYITCSEAGAGGLLRQSCLQEGLAVPMQHCQLCSGACRARAEEGAQGLGIPRLTGGAGTGWAAQEDYCGVGLGLGLRLTWGWNWDRQASVQKENKEHPSRKSTLKGHSTHCEVKCSKYGKSDLLVHC